MNPEQPSFQNETLLQIFFTSLQTAYTFTVVEIILRKSTFLLLVAFHVRR